MSDPEWFDNYKSKINKKINLSLITSTNKKLSTALEFSKCAKKYKDMPGKSVLFVFLFKNFTGFNGVKLNKAEFSAYPYEEEFLLVGGIKIRILKVEEQLMIMNKHKGLKELYDGQLINIIYFYNAM